MPSRVTIVDVAREAGVAISTVSAALNGAPGVSDATRRRVRDVADRLGWVPSVRGRSLSTQHSFALGLVVQRPAGVLGADPFFAAFIGGVESVLADSEHALLLQVSSPQDAAGRLRRLASSGAVDGVFLTDVELDDPRPDIVRRLGVPAVAVNPTLPVPASGLAAVVQDHRAALQGLVEHLVGLGHRRIAHVTGAPGLVHSREREQVWHDVLVAHRLATDLRVAGDFTTESGTRAAEQLLGAGSDRPTAVVCANDLMAIGFLSRAQSLGFRVPEDVSVAGFDGIELGEYLRPSLTTVVTAPALLGRRAASLLLELVGGAPARTEQVEAAGLALRGSTAAPLSHPVPGGAGGPMVTAG